MVEPPSRRLQQILLGLKLCSPRDLRRCASRVKALSADLPAFDSVWLDALVQRRVLTSWQAQTIELDRPELLRVGPCIVEDRLGQSHRSATFLARLPEQKGYCVIKRVSVPSELRRAVGDRLKQLVERSSGLTHSGVIVPHSFSEVSNAPLPELTVGEKLKESAATQASRRLNATTKPGRKGSKSGVSRARRKANASARPNPDKLESELAIVSRLVEGLSLSEILLRRGRLPSADVDAIARQLLESLAALHESGIVHGEILLSNVRLVASGQVVLVDAGVRGVLQPEIQINAHVAPGKNDGIAPELIGTGAVATPRSDLYALGFALWQLLAGRPAFPAGDPLAKLAAHQTERIPDIREFAPETPERLAKMIEWLTEPVASRRPRHARELLDVSRDRTGLARRTLAKSRGRGADDQNAGGGRSGSQEDLRNKSSAQPTAPPQKSVSSQVSRGTVKPAGRASRRRLASFASSFQQPLRRSAKSSTVTRTAKPLACAVAAILIAVAALFTFDARSRSLVLASLPQRFAAFGTDSSAAPLPATGELIRTDSVEGSGELVNTVPATKPLLIDSSSQLPGPADHEVWQNPEMLVQRQALMIPATPQLLPLPKPDSYGVVSLSEPGVYEAGTIARSGSHITLRGPADKPARIAVSTGRALQLQATEVTLENVEFHMNSRASRSIGLLQIRSQKLTCINCDFLSPLGTTSGHSENSIASPLPALAAGIAMQWDAIDPSDPLAGGLTFSHCRFVGSHSSVLLKSPGRLVSFANALKVGGGPLVIATGRAAHGDNVIELEETTLRQSGSLVALDLRDGPPWKSRLTIRPRSSVFDLKSRSAEEVESLVTFAGGRMQLTWHERVGFEGEDSIAGGFVGLASWQATNGSAHQSLDTSEVSVRGLIQTDFTFRGSLSPNRSDSFLSDVQTNRVSVQLPGITSAIGVARQRDTEDEPLLVGPETTPEL